MKSSLFPLLLLLSILLTSNCLFLKVPHTTSKTLFDFVTKENPETSKPGIIYHQVQKWFDGQILDHFNPQDNRTFSQRYWVVTDFYNPSTGPIFLYICGEYTCPGVPSDRLFPLELAQQHQALFVVLEHRFYGLSQPFQNLSTESLSYLAVEQALEDLAYFITWFKVNSGYQITPQQPWIAIGGSYPGALSAWFRYKYPHLTAGNWAASAVINSILDFPNFDYQIYLSTNRSGPECPAIIQNLTSYFETQLYYSTPEAQNELQSKFGQNAMQLSRAELLWYIADVFVESVQYGSRESLCQMLTSTTDFDTLVSKVISFIVASGDARSYGSYFLKNETFDPNTADLGRQWNYQVCSQFGWMQTPYTNPQYAMRSKMVNITFYQQFCEDVFGIPIWPNTDLINMEFGALGLEATNLVMTNGAEDPWQWASLTQSEGAIQSFYVDCPDCGHCVDLYTPTADDAQVLQDTRDKISQLISQFLQGK